MFDGYWREAVSARVDPIGVRLHHRGATANRLTVFGVSVSFAAAAVIATGRMFAGALCLTAAALPDLFDGPAAKAAGDPTTRGAFLDSTADRVTDSVLLLGVVWFYVADERGLVTMVPVSVMAVSWLISYQRAKAESLGLDAKGGIMERAERLVVLGIGLAIPGALTSALWVLLVLSTVTALQRFIKVWGESSHPRRLIRCCSSTDKRMRASVEVWCEREVR